MAVKRALFWHDTCFMTIYTYFDSSHPNPAKQAEFLRLFERSWARHGWTPRVITSRGARSSEHDGLPIRYRAMESVRGSWFADIQLLNVGFRPPTKIYTHCYGDGFYLFCVRKSDWPKLLSNKVGLEVNPLWPQVRYFPSVESALLCSQV